MQTLSHRICRQANPPRQRLAHERYVWLAHRITAIEQTPAPQGNPHGLEMAGARDAILRDVLLRRVAIERERTARPLSGEWQRVDAAHCLDAGHAAIALHGSIELPQLVVTLGRHIRRQPYRHRNGVVGRETGVGGEKRQEGAAEQPGGREQHHGDADLCNEERLTSETSTPV